MECRILECVCGAFVRETGVLCASERLGMKMAGIYIMYGAVFGGTISRHILYVLPTCKNTHGLS